VQGGHLVLETRATGQVLAALDPLTGLDGVQTRTPSLEDVYLDITARQTQAQTQTQTPHTSNNQEQQA
jgi:ABC-2 type transport system ATP-binding protein